MRLSAIALAALLAACSAPAGPPAGKPQVVEPQGQLTLRAARQRWRDSGHDDYRYVLRQECFCPREALRPVRVTVRDGRVVDLVPEQGGDVPDGIRRNARTVPQWFDYIEDWRKRSPARLEVSWQPDTGVPSRILVDRHARMADDEIVWHLWDLVPFSAQGEAGDAEMVEEDAAPADPFRP
jgi:hypothetical protein